MEAQVRFALPIFVNREVSEKGERKISGEWRYMAFTLFVRRQECDCCEKRVAGSIDAFGYVNFLARLFIVIGNTP